MSASDVREEHELCECSARCMLALELLNKRSSLDPPTLTLKFDEVVMARTDVELLLRAATWRMGYLLGRRIR